MKKIILTLVVAIGGYGSYAQNTPWSSTGNIGFGTTNPSSVLSIGGNSTVNPNNTGADILYSALTFQNVNYYNVGRIASLEEPGYNIDAGGLAFSTGYGSLYERLRIKTNGNVGIGTPNPATLLDVYNSANSAQTIVRISGTREAAGNYSALLLGAGGLQGRGKGGVLFEPEGTSYGFGKLHFAVNRVASEGDATLADVKMSIIGNGNVGIGTTTPDQKLTVNGTIHSTEVKVTPTVPVPDYVFEKTYKLINLTELKSFLDANHHLPEIPSAAEIEKNGLNLSEMNLKLLKKVEELTLYLIEKDKQLTEQSAKLTNQQEASKTQQKQIDELKAQLKTIADALAKH